MELLNKLMSKSRIIEIAAVGNRMASVFKKSDWSEELHLTKLFEMLMSLIARLTTAVNRAKKESKLEELDEVRDDKVRAIHYLLIGSLHHPDATVSQSATQVNVVFDRYGLSMIHENYSGETTLIDSMLEDFKASDLQTSIAAISGLAELIEILRVAQANFEETRVDYEIEKTNEGTLENASNIKDKALDLINNQLVVYLRAMIQVDEDKYSELTLTLATIINENNEMVRRRKKKDIEA